MLNNNTNDIDLSNLINLNKTLHELLLEIRNLTSSEGGTIYLKDEISLKFSISISSKANHTVKPTSKQELH